MRHFSLMPTFKHKNVHSFKFNAENFEIFQLYYFLFEVDTNCRCEQEFTHSNSNPTTCTVFWIVLHKHILPFWVHAIIYAYNLNRHHTLFWYSSKQTLPKILNLRHTLLLTFIQVNIPLNYKSLPLLLSSNQIITSLSVSLLSWGKGTLV